MNFSDPTSTEAEYLRRMDRLMVEAREDMTPEQRRAIRPSVVFDDGRLIGLLKEVLAGALSMEEAEARAEHIIVECYSAKANSIGQ